MDYYYRLSIEKTDNPSMMSHVLKLKRAALTVNSPKYGQKHEAGALMCSR